MMKLLSIFLLAFLVCTVFSSPLPRKLGILKPQPGARVSEHGSFSFVFGPHPERIPSTGTYKRTLYVDVSLVRKNAWVSFNAKPV
jgi:hypothetical protein